ncbi:MAG: hypothetical protein GYA24_24465 [Candidatus Lokiarchaeota archaeon]|nr:hypothetical protein [Candidatus Lokiarchaeota archaeon]
MNKNVVIACLTRRAQAFASGQLVDIEHLLVTPTETGGTLRWEMGINWPVAMTPALFSTLQDALLGQPLGDCLWDFFEMYHWVAHEFATQGRPVTVLRYPFTLLYRDGISRRESDSIEVVATIWRDEDQSLVITFKLASE